ncbi:MAG TPA: glycosyltransferase family 2 protein [Longimicrobiales bacterium]|nr:glycosyltransferase family 2 protein [Longimicrobiales bacterium]
MAAGRLPPAPGGFRGWPWEAGVVVADSPAEGDPPVISVIIPSYNQARFLEAAIRSVLLQAYPAVEVMVLDGGSTDGSMAILERYDPWLSWWRSAPDGGQAEAINEGLRRAKGPIVSWLNSDDLLLPGALRVVAGMYRQAPDAAGWVGACYRIDVRRRVLSRVNPRGLDRNSLGDWGYTGFFYQPSCFMSARALDAAGPLDDSLYCAFDLDLWLRLVQQGRFVATPRALSAAVIHEEAKTQAARTAMHAETMHVQFRHGYTRAAERRLLDLTTRPPLRRRILRWLRARRRRTALDAAGDRLPATLDDVPEVNQSVFP